MYWDENGQGVLFAPAPNSEHDTEMWKKFRAYDAENPHIWKAFKKETYSIVQQGYERIGADLIVRLIRWRTPVRQKSGHVKIDHNFFPYYARKFMLEYPSCDGLFELRPLKRKHYNNGMVYNSSIQ